MGGVNERNGANGIAFRAVSLAFRRPGCGNAVKMMDNALPGFETR